MSLLGSLFSYDLLDKVKLKEKHWLHVLIEVVKLNIK